jgi:acetyl esterase/lipase
MKNQSTLLAAFIAIMLFSASCKKDDTTPQSQDQSTKTDISYGADAAQKMDVYLPAGRSTEKTKVLILVHGGAWASGDKNDFNEAVAAIRTALLSDDYAIFNINYRLVSPTGANLWPTQGNDVAAAINFIISKRAEYACNTDKIALMGASAGAHLALLQAYNNNANGKIKVMVDLFGPTDIAALYTSYANNPTTQYGLSIWLAGTPTSNATAYTNASPINFVTAQSPPTIIFHGTADATVPISQSANLKTKLETAGVAFEYVTYTGEGHGWQGANLTDTYTKAIAFIKKYVP